MDKMGHEGIMWYADGPHTCLRHRQKDTPRQSQRANGHYSEDGRARP